MWVILKSSDPGYKQVLLTNRVYVVGRVNADVLLTAQSISRHHANLEICYPDEAVDSRCRTTPALTITDFSRFGTFVNGNRITSNVATTVSSGSEITFGVLPGVRITAMFIPLNVLLSSVPPHMKSEIRRNVQSLGGKVFGDWMEACNLLVMPKLVVTHKVLCALLCGLDIVTPKYLVALCNACHTGVFREPIRSEYFPPIEEKGFTDVDAPKFFANPDRRFVFTNKTFIFLTESKFNRYSLLLSLTNAQTKCIANTAPLSRRELSDLFKSVSDPCLLYEAKTSTPSQQLAELVLKEELDRRPIFDQEITLAIIESSCEIYCNATRRCPSSNDGTFSSLPISIAPSDRAASFSVTNRRCSLLKRPREDTKSDIQSAATIGSKRLRTQAPLSTPPEHVANCCVTSGTKSHVLVPDTEANNSSTVELCNLPGEGGEKDTCQCAPKRGFESPAVEPRGLECEDKRPGEQAHEESVLNAFGSLPSFSTVLKQYKSSVLKANQSGLQVASSGLLTHVDGEASAATGRKASNIPTPQPEDFDSEPSDLLLMKSDNAKSPPSTAQDEENLPHDHQPPPHPLRTDGFLSKEFGRKIASRDEGAENEVNINSSESICVNVKVQFCALVNQVHRKYPPPNGRPTPSFKIFRKVWPVYYKHDANIPEQPSLPQPPAKVTLAPFLPGSKLDAEDRTCNIDTLDQPRDDHSAQIDMLFNELIALPRIRRR